LRAHRIGTVEIESALLTHLSVAEAAVVGKPDALKGEVACAFVVLRSGRKADKSLKEELKETVRKTLGPIVIVDDVAFVSKLPKTRSGKIMRRLIKAVVTEQPLGDYSTIEDASAIQEIQKATEKTSA
jgi:acetyl-CoA synthetase